MRIEIENCLGIEYAELEVEPGEVVSVIGPNAAGKTSFAVAAAAVLGSRGQPSRAVRRGRAVGVPARRGERGAGNVRHRP